MAVEKLSYIISRETDPYHNLALEEYLLKHVREGECILYLWQNRRTVVIGYNQNAWRECRVEALKADGGYVARRLSGGGAVFHDMGNLNFTFLMRKADYDVGRQSEVVLRAAQSFGIPAARNGRNDLTADGRKFSGNAFYRTGDFCYHHGTVLIRSDTAQMGRYLNVSREKLRSKGVESVKGRVVNLEEYVPGLTVEQMGRAFLAAFGEVYGVGAPEPVVNGRIDAERLDERQKYFASWEWVYGRKIPFQYEVSRKFPWGEVQIQLEVPDGVIRRAAVWSDVLDVGFPRFAEMKLVGVRYRKEDLEGILAEAGYAMPYQGSALDARGPETGVDDGAANRGDVHGRAAYRGDADDGMAAGRAVYRDMLADVIACLTDEM